MYTLPTLTQHGLITDKNIIVVSLFKYFITTQKSQSTIYSNHIVSYDYLMKMYNNTPDILRDKMVGALNTLYSRYFPVVDVKINFKDTALYIDIEVKDNDNNTYTLDSSTTGDLITQLDNIVKLYN